MQRGNLRDAIPAQLPDELCTILAESGGARIERIVSRGHMSPPDFWYDQDQAELVFVIDGAARLELADGDLAELGPGDWFLIEAHQRHRVAWTVPDQVTVWLAIFLPAA